MQAKQCPTCGHDMMRADLSMEIGGEEPGVTRHPFRWYCANCQYHDEGWSGERRVRIVITRTEEIIEYLVVVKAEQSTSFAVNTTLDRRHYGELIRAALNKREGWIPFGPLEVARRRPLKSYDRANKVADLERAGLITCTATKKRDKAKIALTEAGKAAILAMPDDIGADLYPLPIDIKEAKEKVGTV